jgi:hypothetical protein
VDYPNSSDGSNSTVSDEPGFCMWFHLSYVVLREGDTCSDPRKLRHSYSMIKPLDGSFENLIYYDAQTSFQITGVDEWRWTAYCLVDTFFQGEQDAETYLKQERDGPSGGLRHASQPCWNPREYFLLVLSQRIKQITKEWGNVLSVLMEHLDSYVCPNVLILPSSC